MARSFNGSTAKIVGASVTPINFDYNSPFSVVGWALSLTASERTIIGHLDTGSGYRGWEIQEAPASIGNSLCFYLISTYPTQFIRRKTSTIAHGQWFHFGLTYSGSGTLAGSNAYLDGSVDNGGTNQVDSLGTNTTTNAIVPYIGQRNNATNPFYGNCADLGIWNTALTANEIASLAKGKRPHMVRPKSLVAYWPLDGLQSPEPDLSGNANNGTLTGTAYANGPPVTLFAPKTPWFIPTITPTTTILYGHNIGASFTRKITTIGY